jgi:hypothetical protein
MNIILAYFALGCDRALDTHTGLKGSTPMDTLRQNWSLRLLASFLRANPSSDTFTLALTFYNLLESLWLKPGRAYATLSSIRVIDHEYNAYGEEKTLFNY